MRETTTRIELNRKQWNELHSMVLAALRTTPLNHPCRALMGQIDDILHQAGEDFSVQPDGAVSEYLDRMTEKLGPGTVVDARYGRRYVSVTSTTPGSQPMLVFIDKTNGDVLATTGDRKPSKHIIDNIFVVR